MVQLTLPRKLRKWSRGYLLVVATAVAGCVFLLLDHSEYDAADAFRSAVECPDASTGRCYQLYPGVIQAVRVVQTTSGKEEVVDIVSRGSTVHVTLLPSLTDASLVQVGTAVSVEWYVGSVAAVWVGHRAIPSTANLAIHSNFAYLGWLLLWLAARFCAILLLNRRMLALFAAMKVLPATVQVASLGAREVILPGGTTGWVVKPGAREAQLLPLVFAALVVISVRPLINTASRPFALAGDLSLFGLAIISLGLTLRNSRLMADRASITWVDLLGRARSWSVTEIDRAAIVGLRWTDWAVPALLFVGRDGRELFRLSGVYWNLDEIGAVCTLLGIPLTPGYVPIESKRAKRLRFAIGLVSTLISGALLVVSVLQLTPPSS